MSEPEQTLLEVRESLRHLLMIYRNDKVMRTYSILSLWSANRMIDAYNASNRIKKRISERTKQK